MKTKTLIPFTMLLLYYFTIVSVHSQEAPTEPYDPGQDPLNLPFPIPDNDTEEVETEFDWPLRDLPTIDQTMLAMLSEEEQDEKKENNEYIKKLFKKTAEKTYWALGQKILPESTYLVCEVFAFPFVFGQQSNKENKRYQDPYQVYVNTQMPGPADQVIVLETLVNKELLRDINQTIAYTQQALDFGLGMITENEEVMDQIGPERIYKRRAQPIRPEEEEQAEVFTYNGMTQQQFSASVQNAIGSISNLEFTGDAAADGALISEAIAPIATHGNEEEVTAIMQQIMSDQGYSGEIEEEELALIVSEIIAEHWQTLLGKYESGRLHLQYVEAVLARGLDDRGLEKRNTKERYAEASEPYYTSYKKELDDEHKHAIDVLTIAINSWNMVQEKKYIEKAELMYGIGQDIINNGDSYIEDYKDITAEGEIMVKVIELIKLLSDG